MVHTKSWLEDLTKWDTGKSCRKEDDIKTQFVHRYIYNKESVGSGKDIFTNTVILLTTL